MHQSAEVYGHKVALYVSERDWPLFEKARKELAKRRMSLSVFVARAVELYLENTHEALPDELEECRMSFRS